MNLDRIDMVYLWCDGNDPEFISRKNQYLDRESILSKNNSESIGNQRFIDNDELRYSLRSLEMNAPWINHVFIVTDRQIPKWLNISYEKVTVVDHSEIMPKEIIPCFNSTVLEYYLPFIPTLSEKFLYGNDDMFFGKPVVPEFFFIGDHPIVRAKKVSAEKLKRYSVKEYTYFGSVFGTLNIVNEKYNKFNFYLLHHNIDAYTKSLYRDALNRYKNEIDKYKCCRFRKTGEFQRTAFSLDMVYSNMAILKTEKDYHGLMKYILKLKGLSIDSYCGEDNNDKTIKDIDLLQPYLFCINSGQGTSENYKKKYREFLEYRFPEPSSFEK